MKLRALWTAVSLCWLTACGGGGDSASPPPPAPPPPPTADLSIALHSPASSVPTEVVVWFDLTVVNRGAIAATNVQASRVLPSTFSLMDVDCSATGGATCPADASSLAVPTLPPNSALNFRLYTLLSPNARGANTVQAAVTASNMIGSRTAQYAVSGYRADILVSGSAPATPLPAGTQAQFTMDVTNAGPDDASHVVIHNILDPNLALRGITCTATGGSVCPPTVASTMSGTFIPAGGRLRFMVTADPWAGTIGPISNTLRTSAWGDPEIHNNSATAVANVAVPSNPGTLVQLQSDTGDFIGQGGTYVYDPASAVISVAAAGSTLEVNVFGSKRWWARFQLPGGLSRLQPGTYANLPRATVPPAGGLDWSGDGRSCNSLTGTIIVDEAVYSGASLERVDLRFEQHCDHASPALRGRVRWVANDTTPAPAPVTPTPANLWRPAAGSTPGTGSYVYLREEPYEPTGSGIDRIFTLSDSAITLDINAWRFNVRVQGDENWIGSFHAMENLTQLQPGFYRGLAFESNPARGSFWFNSNWACSHSMSWVAIDHIAYTAGALSAIDLRFERRCESPMSTLHGQIHWVAGDGTQPPLPQWPLPAGLWAPPAGSTPASGSYVYLESDPGDYIGQGVTRLFTPASTAMTVSGSGRWARVWLPEGLTWSGDFEAMTSVARLTPGFYPGVKRSGTHNPARGGLAWSGDGRACNESWGWFAVDSVTYVGDELQSLELRFEQHCEGMEPALRGKIRWVN